MWYYFKEPVVQFIGISREALHIHIGLFLFIIGSILFRNASNKFLCAWVIVLIAQSINEFFDFYDWYIWTKSWNWHKSLYDFIHTMFWPSVILLLKSK